MDAIQTILRQLDDAWAHKWESVTGVLDGVSEAEAAWQAPAYADGEREAGWPRPGTIHWQVAHLVHCKRDYAAHIHYRGRTTERASIDAAPSPSYEAELAALHEAHAALRSEVVVLTAEDLALEANHTMELDEFLAMAIRHDTWHAGQIAVARRLYRGRP